MLLDLHAAPRPSAITWRYAVNIVGWHGWKTIAGRVRTTAGSGLAARELVVTPSTGDVHEREVVTCRTRPGGCTWPHRVDVLLARPGRTGVRLARRSSSVAASDDAGCSCRAGTSSQPGSIAGCLHLLRRCASTSLSLPSRTCTASRIADGGQPVAEQILQRGARRSPPRAFGGRRACLQPREILRIPTRASRVVASSTLPRRSWILFGSARRSRPLGEVDLRARLQPSRASPSQLR